MSLLSRFRFTTAWLPAGWARNVVISVDLAGDIVHISTDDAVTPARLVNGAAIPGMPNVHSHAFQRAMAGLAERRTSNSDSFWSWRELMYQFASRMTPELLNAVAAQLYADMLKAGYTSVCEFHYLHNQPDGSPYSDASVMCQSLIDAAATSGIGLTLLPTLYQSSDFGGAPPSQRQKQFTLETERFLALVERFRHSLQYSTQLQVGVAFHSLRAVQPEAMQAVLAAGHDCKVIHIHIAEQEREVATALQHLQRRPIEWLLENARIDDRWCLVHATHATVEELAGVAAKMRSSVCVRRPKRTLAMGCFQSNHGCEAAVYSPSAPTATSRSRRAKNCAGWIIRPASRIASATSLRQMQNLQAARCSGAEPAKAAPAPAAVSSAHSTQAHAPTSWFSI